MDEKCWKLHFELPLKLYESKKGAMKTIEIERMYKEYSFDVDKNHVFVTLQEPRESGEINALF